MPVPSSMSDLSTLASSNSPAGAEVIGNSLDNYIRAVSAILRSTNALASVVIAAASTTDVATADAESVAISGSATITSLGTGFNGCRRELRFQGVCTLTHSANLVLPGGANITTASNDFLTFRCTASGQWVLVASSIVPSRMGAVAKVGDTMTGALNLQFGTVATQQILQGFGWDNGIARWRNVINANASLSLFNYDAAGGTPLQALTLNNATGDLTSSGTVTANGALASSTVQLLVGTSGAGIIALRANGVTSNVNQGLYDSSGNLGIAGTGTGVNWVATSDKDLKSGVESIGADQFLADRLRFVEFDWKDTGRHDYGVIAQEVQMVAPRYVYRTPTEDGLAGHLAVDKASLALEAVIGLAERVRKLEGA